MRKLSELEGAVLGVVSGHGPLTPYQVRKVFAHSPNPHWSASAGSIYPLIRRLARQRWLAARGHATGARKSRKYTLTAAGRRALRGWILEVGHKKIATTSDLVRLRVFFLAALAPGERRKFVDRMIQKLAAMSAKNRAYCRERERAGDRFGHLGARGAVLMNLARLQWLKEVRAKLRPVGGKG
jgi:DNA-binding PadR family transcriptional regulator